MCIYHIWQWEWGWVLLSYIMYTVLLLKRDSWVPETHYSDRHSRPPVSAAVAYIMQWTNIVVIHLIYVPIYSTAYAFFALHILHWTTDLLLAPNAQVASIEGILHFLPGRNTAMGDGT